MRGCRDEVIHDVPSRPSPDLLYTYTYPHTHNTYTYMQHACTCTCACVCVCVCACVCVCVRICVAMWVHRHTSSTEQQMCGGLCEVIKVVTSGCTPTSVYTYTY